MTGFELGVALDLVKDLDIVIADPHSDVAGPAAPISLRAQASSVSEMQDSSPTMR